MVPSSDLYKDFYYPIGGLTAVAKSVPRAAFESTVQERSFETPTIPAMVSVFHFHSEKLRGSRKYHKASVNKARHAVIKLSHHRGKPTVAPDNITKRWEKFRGNAALMYAASTLLVPDQENERRKTLFDAVRDGTANFEEHGHLVQEWIARARFVCQHVLAHCHKGREIADENIEGAFSATAPLASRRLKI
jgi:hypothetical protein